MRKQKGKDNENEAMKMIIMMERKAAENGS